MNVSVSIITIYIDRTMYKYLLLSIYLSISYEYIYLYILSLSIHISIHISMNISMNISILYENIRNTSKYSSILYI